MTVMLIIVLIAIGLSVIGSIALIVRPNVSRIMMK